MIERIDGIATVNPELIRSLHSIQRTARITLEVVESTRKRTVQLNAEPLMVVLARSKSAQRPKPDLAAAVR